MSYLMMHTTQPLICSRHKDFPVRTSVGTDYTREWEIVCCQPSAFMSITAMTGSFDTGTNSILNEQHNSEYNTGHHVSDEAELLVSGIVMAIKKAQ